MPPVALIAAVARNRVIGGGNQLLWRLKTDLRRFRALTLGKPLIMGRKTFDSIGRPLPGRHCIIITRDRALKIAGAETAHSLDQALALAAAHAPDEIMIGGGGEIYAAAMAGAQRLYITHVDLEPEGDTYFPAIDPKGWKRVKSQDHSAGGDDEAAFTFADYSKKKG